MKKTVTKLIVISGLCLSCAAVLNIENKQDKSPIYAIEQKPQEMTKEISNYETQKRIEISSYPYPLIKWNNQVYRITTTNVIDVDEEIGEIMSYSTDETQEEADNFSNYYKIGTKIWSIHNAEENKEVAIEILPDIFVKAVSNEISQ